MHETKETNSDRTTTLQELKGCIGISESSTHGALLLGEVFYGLRPRKLSRCKQNKVV